MKKVLALLIITLTAIIAASVSNPAMATTESQNCSAYEQTTLDSTTVSTNYGGSISLTTQAVGWDQVWFEVYRGGSAAIVDILHDTDGSLTGILDGTGKTQQRISGVSGDTFTFTIRKNAFGTYDMTLTKGSTTRTMSSINLGGTATHVQDGFVAEPKSPCIAAFASVYLSTGTVPNGSFVSAFPYYLTTYSSTSFEVDTI